MADLKTLMEDIARAIRLKTGVSDKINAQDFPQKIREIEIGEKKEQLKFNISTVEIITPFSIQGNLIINTNNISATTLVELTLEE